MNKKIATVLKPAMKLKKYIITGLVLMMFYALFGAASIAVATPMFDYVFKNKSEKFDYNTTVEVFEGVFNIIPAIFDSTFKEIGKRTDMLLDSPKDFIEEKNLKVKSNNSSFKLVKSRFEDLFRRSEPLSLLWFVVIILMSSTILKNLSYMGSRVVMSAFTGKLVKTIREEIFSKYLDLPLSFFSKNRTGDSQVRIFTDVRVVADLYLGSLISITRESITFIIFLSIALFISTKLLLYTLILVPIFSVVISFLGKKIKKYAKRIQNKISDLLSGVDEVFTGIKIVKAYQKEDQERESFRFSNDRYYKFWLKSKIYAAMSQPLSEINGVLTGSIIMILGGSMVLDPQSGMSFGSFIAFMAAILQILHPIKVITKGYNDIKKAGVSLDRLYAIFSTDNLIHEIENPVEVDSFKSKITIKNIYYAYEDEKYVLKDVSFEIKKGEKVAFVGASGSGKTTITNLLNRMYDVDRGEILLDDVNIKNLRLKSLRKLFGTVTQESILFNRSIKENIGYGSYETASLDEVKRAAKIACCDQFIENLELGYDTIIDPKGSNFSGGQRQRLSIARSIVGDPPILIFDEATSALDTVAEQKVQEGIDNATENRTVIVVAHRLSTILNSDKIVVFDNGKVVGVGKNDDLLKSCEIYKKLHDLQFDRSR
ncbi:MAG: hypothetical protein CR982_01400 [Candidatus Cloacimonadota bacterium]|nr:MAG: hypothetical protein CR982_01400 [Candidatus Cloacimonadota bacterium]PIE79571.1 MAG: hypothetical protein CSA15_02825 [Candidatus Delongbacteria bacterium]